VLFVLEAPLFRFIPLPVISAIILSSVFTMPNWQEIPHLIKAPILDAAGWVATSFLTIVTDIPTAVAVGMLIGMFIYIRKKPGMSTWEGAAGGDRPAG
jgi:SulP family sulfate permease